jgi:hypothetical protein
VPGRRPSGLAGLQPFPDPVKHVFRLPFALAVKHRIVGIPGKPDAWQMPCHPQIKRIVQEQIGQDRRHDTPLRRPGRPELKNESGFFHSRVCESPLFCVPRGELWKQSLSDYMPRSSRLMQSSDVIIAFAHRTDPATRALATFEGGLTVAPAPSPSLRPRASFIIPTVSASLGRNP